MFLECGGNNLGLNTLVVPTDTHHLTEVRSSSISKDFTIITTTLVGGLTWRTVEYTRTCLLYNYTLTFSLELLYPSEIRTLQQKDTISLIA